MSTANPLVATAVDSTTPFQGAFLLEDGEALVGAIQSGDWVAGGLAAFSAVADGIATISDPLGSLIAAGLGWVMEHLEPLKGWLDDLTGDADEVAAFAQTWNNIAGQLSGSADELVAVLADLDAMDGEAIAAYRAFQQEAADHLRGSADWANAMGVGFRIASTLVQIVHDLVRDAIAQVVGAVVSYAAELVLTLGLATPLVIEQASSRVASLVGRIGKTLQRLLDAGGKLMQLVDKLQALFRRAGEVFESVLRGGTPHPAGGAPHPSPGHAVPHEPGVPPPSTRLPDTSPHGGADVPEVPAPDVSAPGGGGSPFAPPPSTLPSEPWTPPKLLDDPVSPAPKPAVPDAPVPKPDVPDAPVPKPAPKPDVPGPDAPTPKPDAPGPDAPAPKPDSPDAGTGTDPAAHDPKAPEHTGLDAPTPNPHDPGRLPDLTDINDRFRTPDGQVDPGRIDEWAEAVSERYPELTPQQVKGVYDYTTNPGYESMNPYLRGYGDLTVDQAKALGFEPSQFDGLRGGESSGKSIADLSDGQRAVIESRITATSDGLSNLPPYRAAAGDEFSTTYRGATASPEFLAKFQEGGTFADEAFMSTSTRTNIADEFSHGVEAGKTPVVFTVEGRSGVDVQQLSMYRRETEVLFQRGTEFDVVSRATGSDGIVRILLRER